MYHLIDFVTVYVTVKLCVEVVEHANHIHWRASDNRGEGERNMWLDREGRNSLPVTNGCEISDVTEEDGYRGDLFRHHHLIVVAPTR